MTSYVTKTPLLPIPSSRGDLLEAPLSTLKLEEAFKMTDVGKSPGLNRFTPRFHLGNTTNASYPVMHRKPLIGLTGNF